jgi:hypothetical protein
LKNIDLWKDKVDELEARVLKQQEEIKLLRKNNRVAYSDYQRVLQEVSNNNSRLPIQST